ncbi:MAG: hypothetical protein QXF82_05065 [Nitrososphaeria archaeon]
MGPYVVRDFRPFIILAFFYLLVIGSYLYAYPFFPIMYSQDYFTYLSNSLNLANGIKVDSLFFANPAIALLLASWISLNFNDVLFLTRLFLAFILWSSLPFIYFIGDHSGGERGGLIATIVYIAMNPFLTFTMLYSGLYANALGITLGLSAISWFIVAIKEQSVKRMIFLPLYGFILIFSHSTNILIYATLFLSTLYLKIFENKKGLMKPFTYLFLGISPILLLTPVIISRLPSTLSSPFLLIEASSNEFFSYVLRNLPLLKFIYLSSGENIFSLILLTISLTLTSLYLLKKKLEYYIIPFSWLVLIIVISQFSTNVWRFALLAFVPLSLISPLVYEKILSPLISKTIHAMPSKVFKKTCKYLILAFMIILLYLPSHSNIILPIYASSWSRPQQEGFYECLLWFRENSEYNSTVASLGGGPYMYFLPYIANRSFLRVFPGENPEYIYDILKNYSTGYVVVWNRLHPYNGSFYYVNLYKNSSLFREVWSNSEVTVFKLVRRE